MLLSIILATGWSPLHLPVSVRPRKLYDFLPCAKANRRRGFVKRHREPIEALTSRSVEIYDVKKGRVRFACGSVIRQTRAPQAVWEKNDPPDSCQILARVLIVCPKI
jgi:hypothetical protein